jgi:hypothetical protein
MAKQRIPITTIDSTYSDGDILYGYDVNRIIDVFREAANKNKIDINKILTGTDYPYIAEDLSGLQGLAVESTPSDNQKGFVFDGELKIYTYDTSNSSWNFLSNISLINPYVESISIDGALLEYINTEQNKGLEVQVTSKFRLKIGQQVVFYGKASGAIAKGDAVQFAGAQGDHFLIKKAVQSEINASPEYFIGIAAQDLSNEEYGFVLEFGPLTGVLKTGLVQGNILWFDSQGTTPGALTNVKPARGFAQIRVAAVINSQNAQLGQWLVRPDRIEETDGFKIFVQSDEPTNALPNDFWYEIDIS